MLKHDLVSLRVAPRRHSRLRLAAFRAVEWTAAALGGRAFYRRCHLAAGRFRVREETVPIAGLPPGLDGFVLVQVSDLHAGSFLGAGDLSAVVIAVNALEADVCVLTGDFITHHWSESLRVLDDCAALRARCGVFAVFGNHDYKDRLEGRIADAFGARGIRFLRNECVRVGAVQECIALVGIEDLEESREIDLTQARAGLAPTDIEIVLCHNPSGARAVAREGCAAILSGHTHGGQIDLPVLRRLGPAHPGLRLQVGPTTLIVSRGLGVIGFPLRFRAPAEIVVVRLVRATR